MRDVISESRVVFFMLIKLLSWKRMVSAIDLFDFIIHRLDFTKSKLDRRNLSLDCIFKLLFRCLSIFSWPPVDGMQCTLSWLGFHFKKGILCVRFLFKFYKFLQRIFSKREKNFSQPIPRSKETLLVGYTLNVQPACWITSLYSAFYSARPSVKKQINSEYIVT